MATAHGDDHVIVEQKMSLEIGAFDALVEHRQQQIEIAAVELHQQLGDGAAAHQYVERRALGGHVQHGARDHAVEHARPRCHTQRDLAGGQALQLVEVFARAAELGADRAGAAIEDVPRLGRAHAARAALQQLGAELVLEQAQALAERGLGDVETVRRAAQAAAFHHVDEPLDLTLIHVEPFQMDIADANLCILGDVDQG